jgi:thiol-disulfide isomerase/thioredoxin
MNQKKIWTIVGIAVLLIGAGVWAAEMKKNSQKSERGEMVEEYNMEEKEADKRVLDGGDMMRDNTNSDMRGAMNKNGAMQGAMNEKAGTYEAYAPEKIAMAATGKVVLFFRAGWCPTCRAVNADIISNANNIPPNTTILDVNYDTSAALKKKYGVTMQHTFVEVDAQGALIKKWTGSPTLAALVSEIK